MATTDNPIEEMSTTEVEREIAELVFGERYPHNRAQSKAWIVEPKFGDYIPLPFCSDLNACHAAWRMLTGPQMGRVADAAFHVKETSNEIGGFFVAMNAYADQLARWILAAARGGK